MDVQEYYKPLIRGVNLLNKGFFNGLVAISPTGLGKSYQIDEVLKNIKADFIVFKGEISEPKFYEFLQKNSEGKILVFRDMGRLLRRIQFIDILKNLIEPYPVRKIARMTYAKHKGVSEEFDFKGKIIIELNEISKRYQQDIDALRSRGLFIELNFSRDDIKNLMGLICKSDLDKQVTKHLISKSLLLGRNELNLRTQNKCFIIAKAAEKDKLAWKPQVDLFLNTQSSLARKLLYRCAGMKKVKRMEFVKYLIREFDYTLSRAQSRINNWLFLGEIESDGKEKQAMLWLKK